MAQCAAKFSARTAKHAQRQARKRRVVRADRGQRGACKCSMVPKLSMVPNPFSALQIGTFIGRGPHLRGSPVNKTSMEKEDGGGRGALGKSCGVMFNGSGVSSQKVEM